MSIRWPCQQSVLICALILVSFFIFSSGNNNSSIGPMTKISESAKPGFSILGKNTAFKVIVNRKPVDCRLELHSSSSNHFCIGERDGIVRLISPLDKEAKNEDVIVEYLRCADGATSLGHFSVLVQDVNDNPPQLDIQSPIVINPGSNWQGQFQVIDPDETKGQNITATLTDPEWASNFSVSCTDQNQTTGKALSCKLTYKVSPGQEQDNPIVYVPIEVSDSSMNSTRYLPVHLTLTSAMKNARINVRVFKNKNSVDTEDLGPILESESDQNFQIKQPAPDGFSLSEDNTNMTVQLAFIKPGTHQLQLTVTEPNAAPFELPVDIQVHEITNKHLRSAGSIRIQNILVEDFLRPLTNNTSQYETLQAFLARKFNVTVSEVAIFSLIPEGRHPEILQIYFAIDGTRMNSTYINGILSFHKEELEEELGLGARVVQVGVNDCVFENCGGGCKNELVATGGHQVLNAEFKRYIVIEVKAITRQQCQDEAPENCSSIPCLNGGLCHDLQKSGVFCQCPPGTGPYCQGRMRTFNGNGYIWLDPIRPCEFFHLSFHFMTEQSEALLLYNGPMTKSDTIYSPDDFIGVYISGRKVTLSIFLGNGSHSKVENLVSKTEVADGKWHRVDVDLMEGRISLSIDDVEENKVEVTEFVQLNVNDPLQIGGLARLNDQVVSYPDQIAQSPNFDGSIRDVYLNGVLQDLTNPVHAFNNEPGNHTTDVLCFNFCAHGLCVASIKDTEPKCECDIGYMGVRCDQKVTWYQFNEKSYIEYSLSPSMASTNDDVEILMAVKDEDGVLFHAEEPNGHKLMVTNWHLGYQPTQKHQKQSNNQPDLLNMTMPLKAMEPYHVHLTRKSGWVTLKLDSGLPPFVQTRHNPHQSMLDANTGTGIFVGAESSNADEDFRGCIAQVSYNGHQLELSPNSSKSQSQSPVFVVANSNVSMGCPILPTCATANRQCPSGRECQDFWKGPFCTCPLNAQPVFDSDGHWIGCKSLSAFTLGITTEAIIIIVLCLLILLCLILLLILCICCRRQRRQRPFSSLTPSPSSGARENLGRDDLEGVGEKNRSRFDKNVLRVPLLEQSQRRVPSVVGSVTGPMDEKRLYGVELPSGSTGSLSPLPSDDEGDVNWLQIEKFGPKFAKLTEIR